MTNSNNLLLPRPLAKWPIWLLLAFSFVGFADASFLTIKHYTGGPIPCSLLEGCETVTTSIYSTMAGLPLALWGALFYLAVFILVLVFWQNRKKIVLDIVWFFSLVAFLASLVLVYLQFFVINALCLYCLISAATSTLIFLLVSWWRTKLFSYQT